MKRDRKIHVSRAVEHKGWTNEVRLLFRYQSRRISEGGKTVLGKVKQDWAEGGKWGWYWEDLAGDCGPTFPLLRECVADFEREMASRRIRANARP